MKQIKNRGFVFVILVSFLMLSGVSAFLFFQHVTDSNSNFSSSFFPSVAFANGGGVITVGSMFANNNPPSCDVTPVGTVRAKAGAAHPFTASWESMGSNRFDFKGAKFYLAIKGPDGNITTESAHSSQIGNGHLNVIFVSSSSGTGSYELIAETDSMGTVTSRCVQSGEIIFE